MTNPKEEGNLNSTLKKDESKFKMLKKVLKEYFSPHNWKIFLFMVLSVIPAAVCQAFYMSSRVLRIEGSREILLYKVDYSNIPPEYDFIIGPLGILITLNFGLILMKFLGDIFGNKKFLSNYTKLLVIILSFLIIPIAYLYGASSYELLVAFLSLIIVLFVILKGTFSKIDIFPILLLLNISAFIVSSHPFHAGDVFNEGVNDFLFYLASIGVSSLYILPYNFFLFFPFIIGIYFSNFRYPEKYLLSFFDVVFHENMVKIFIGLLLCMMFSFVPFFIILAQLPSDFILYSLPIGIFGTIINRFSNVFVESGGGDLRVFEILALFHLWIGSFMLWFTPFVVSLTQLETKFEANFDRQLRGIIQQMRNHIVIIGFGNLGKNVCNDLIKRDVISLKKDTIEILTPEPEVRKICNRLLVVDINDELFDRVHMDPILQNVGVARRTIKIAGEEDILIPAIIGDINSETIRDSSRLKNSQLLISAPSDYRATFTLSKYANSKDLDSVISVEDSAQKDYFFPKMTAHDTFLIYPAFQEGINLGRITSLCYFKLNEGLKKEENNLRIAIAGEGKQIFYLMETFWMEIKRTGLHENFRKKEENDNQDSGKKTNYTLPITILTDSKELKRRIESGNDSKDKEKMETGEIIESSSRKDNTNVEPEDNLKNKKRMKIEEIIERSSRKDKSNVYSSVDIIIDTPDRLKTIEKIISKDKPQIIVVTSDTIQNVTKIFHEWVVGVERHISAVNKDYKPTIIVGVRGDEYEEIQDILLYYAKMEPKSGLKFPIQYLDASVKVYDDSKEQIGGLAQSLTRKSRKEYLMHDNQKIGEVKEPFAIYCCVEDVPGILGNMLGKLAGVRFTNVESQARNMIYLHFCRFRRCSGVENYSFLSNAELYKKEDINREGEFLFCLYQGESQYSKRRESNQDKREDSERKDSTRELLRKLLNIKYITKVLENNGDVDEKLSYFREICLPCSRKITCSISSYLRKVENFIANRDYYEQWVESKKRQDQNNEKERIVDQELNRFLINPDYQHHNTNENLEPKNLPKASILVCCRNPNITGSLSTAVNNLLFKKVDKIYGKKFADITYLRSYGCYDTGLINIELYGNWVDTNKDRKTFEEKISYLSKYVSQKIKGRTEDTSGDIRENLKENGPIDSIFINVVTGEEEWFDYAKNLCSILNKIYDGDKYELWTDCGSKDNQNSKSPDNELPNNIAIIRKGFKKKSKNNNPQKIHVKCEKRECMLHKKVTLLKSEVI